MAYDTQISTIDLANIYARYFVEDFAANVMRHLAGSHPLPDSADFIEGKVAKAFSGPTPVQIAGSNAIGRFLYECAQHALEENIPDPTSRKTWASVCVLPSLHHDELNAMVYSSAAIYRKTVDVTLKEVITRDAITAAQSITQAAQARVATTETGGNLHFFNWGILSDGMWLNGALVKAYEMASIFHPGDKVVQYFSTVAFDFARTNAITLRLEDEVVMSSGSELDMVIAHIDSDEFTPLLDIVSQADLTALLFQPGVLANKVAVWEMAGTLTGTLIPSVTELSALARMISAIQDTIRIMEDETLVSDLTRHRLTQVYNVITLVLAGYEALRETKFADALIINVIGEGDDPKVDVVVNKDIVNAYRASGGNDADLIRFGLYLDPRKGIPVPGYGYSLSWINARRDDVIPKIMADDADRLDRLRSNDAAAIQALALKIINKVVQSYLDARGITTVRPDIFQRIAGLTRQVTDDKVSVDVSLEIMKILIMVIEDPFLLSVGTELVGQLSSSNEYNKSNAAALTIAATAVDDAIMFITNNDD